MPGWLGSALEGFHSSAGKRQGMAGTTLRFFFFFFFKCVGQSLGLRCILQSMDIFLLGILASAAKKLPVLVSALVFLLKITSVVLHSAPLPGQGRAARAPSVYVTKPFPKLHHAFFVFILTK